MTKLSVNLNKIALLRNSRGRDFPNVVDFAKKFIQLGVTGITVHPRQDERHITVQDTLDLADLLKDNIQVEFNIEGYPSDDFLALVEKTSPDQCTLVPDSPDQLTSDHGWDLIQHGAWIKEISQQFKKSAIRTSIFLDPDINQVKLVKATGAERIELYTEAYAASYEQKSIFKKYQETALLAQQQGIGVNAGHDLDLQNLAHFLTIPNILEVSIGHVLTIECIEQGMPSVIKKYLNICENSAKII